MPNGAEHERRRTVPARNAEERQMPNGAKCRRARDARERANDARGNRRTLMVVQLLFRSWRALWHLATSGIWRRMAFRAVTVLRRSGFAPFGILRLSAVAL
jgi:hypothetical protein